jgi:hypothetical protein
VTDIRCLFGMHAWKKRHIEEHGLPGVSTLPQADRPAHPRPDGHRRRPRVRVTTRHPRPSYLEATDAIDPRWAYPAGLGHGHRSRRHLQPGHPGTAIP